MNDEAIEQVIADLDITRHCVACKAEGVYGAQDGRWYCREHMPTRAQKEAGA